MSDIPARPEISRLALAAGVLGLLSLLGLASMVTSPLLYSMLWWVALAAVLCGHVSRWRIKRSAGTRSGSEIALIALVFGYFSLFATFNLHDDSIPPWRVLAVQQQAHARQIRLALEQMALDRAAVNDPRLGYPADAGITSAAQLQDIMLKSEYLNAKLIKALRFDDFLIGNTSASDPGETILLRTKNDPSETAATVIVLKNGDSFILRPGEPLPGRPAPREPAWLTP